MLFYAPPPEFWDDPSPFPYSRLMRWLWSRVDGSFASPREAWRATWRRYYERLDREAEEYERYLAEVEEYERLMADYEAEGEHLAEMLPYYLHSLGLSYKRTVQDRKHEGRVRERVDYVHIEEWYWDEAAYYFWVNTWEPGIWPSGLSKKQFLEPDVAETLKLNTASANVYVEVNENDHQRPGLWIVIEHKAGRGAIPKNVTFSSMLKALPQNAAPLSSPAGVGINGQFYYEDLEETTSSLIVGVKNSGKSNRINVTLATWLTRVGPETLRLFMTDLKGGLEFWDYAEIPHLGGDRDIKMRLEKDGPLEPVRLGQEIMTEPHQVAPALKYIEAEMGRRQKLMRGKARKLSAYNRKCRPENRLSYWVLVIDELATLAYSKQKTEIYNSLAEIVRKGRATGIYAVLATQVPDGTVITRQVAGNMDSRYVGRVGDGPTSGLSLGDGSWDATRIAAIPGRFIWRWGSDKVQIQVPFIPEGTIRRVIRDVVEGKMVDKRAAEERATVMELFHYALEYLGGQCHNLDLFKHFKKRLPRNKIARLMKDWEVRRGPNGLEPKLSIGEDDYYLAPALPTGPDGSRGRTPRALVPADEFEAQFEEIWAEYVKPTKNQEPKTVVSEEPVTDSDSKTPKTGQPDEAETELAF